MTALELLVVVAVLVGMSLQATIGFGFAFCVAPATFAAYPPEEAVMFILILAIAINSLVLFGERRSPQVATRMSATIVLAAVPAMLIGVWLLQLIDRQVLQVLVGVVILIGPLSRSAPRLGRGGARRRPAATRLESSLPRASPRAC